MVRNELRRGEQEELSYRQQQALEPKKGHKTDRVPEELEEC